MRKYLALVPFALIGWLSIASAWAQENVSRANEAVTGTTIGKLAKYTNTNPVTAIIATTSDTSGQVQGIVTGFDLQGSTGTTGNAYIAKVGTPNCTFDTGGVTANHYVIASTVSGGSCRDSGIVAGASCPAVQVIGVALATGASGASVQVDVTQTCPGGGGGSSAFSALTGGTNSSAAMVVGTGASLGPSGSGAVTATAAPLSGVTGLGSGVGTALAIAHDSSGGVCTVGGSGCPGGGSGSVTVVTLAPGFTKTVGTCNPGTDTITTTGTINGQLCIVLKTSGSPYTVLTTDTGNMLLAGAGSYRFNPPNPSSGTKGSPYSFGSDGTNGYTLGTLGGTATFYGSSHCTGATTAVVPANIDTFIEDDGINYKCTEASGGAGSGTLTNLAPGPGIATSITGGQTPITTTGTLGLASTAVTPGPLTAAA